MARSGSQHHSNEVIQRAIALWEGGMALSAVSREVGVSKTTVKYWIDNAAKFKPGAGGKSSEIAASRLGREASEQWTALLIRDCKQLGRKMEQATFRELTDLLKVLREGIQQMSAATGEGRIPSRVLEVHQQYKLEVQEFLKKQDPAMVVEAATASEGSLAASPVERRAGDEAQAATTPSAAAPTEANGAT